MKLICYVIGALLIVTAVIYFVIPADSLPSFFPGHEAGMMRIRTNHGMVAGIAGVVLFAIGWFVGRRG